MPPMTPDQLEKTVTDLQATVKAQGDTIKSQADTIKSQGDTITAHGKDINDAKTSLTDHSKQLQNVNVIIERHDDAINKIKAKADAAPAAPGTSVVKKDKFKGQAAVNKDTSGKTENEYHFTVDSKNYRFKTESVALPPNSPLGPVGTRVTALVAQGNTQLKETLVKMGSDQIKEVD